jgi:hypothetical protein
MCMKAASRERSSVVDVVRMRLMVASVLLLLKWVSAVLGLETEAWRLLRVRLLTLCLRATVEAARSNEIRHSWTGR